MLRLWGFTLRFSCFITKSNSIKRQRRVKGKPVWSGLRLTCRVCSRRNAGARCVVGLLPVRAYLCGLSTWSPLLSVFMADGGGDKEEHHTSCGFMWQTDVGILDLLKHLTQSTWVTFKIKFDRHSWKGPWVKFDWQTREGGPWQANRVPERRKACLLYVLASIHIVKLELCTLYGAINAAILDQLSFLTSFANEDPVTELCSTQEWEETKL